MRFVWLFVLCLLAADAAAVTYDVRVLYVCATEANCQPDEDFTQLFEGVNRRFKPLGIAFRPNVELVVDETYAAIREQDDPALDELYAMAQATPGQITAIAIFGFGNGHTCWGATPQNQPAGSANAYALFCYSESSAATWAHELGHYFCLPHTFTFQDPASHSPVDHDGDDLGDTPPDPGVEEEEGIPSDEPDVGAGREWCEDVELDHAYTDPLPAWRQLAGGVRSWGCTTACVTTTSSGTLPAPFAPLGENGMSYYQSCAGPWSRNGVRHEFFTPQQATRMNVCRANEPERAALVDACATRGGDTDLDGLCDDEDACPTHFALVGMDEDDDDDGIVDGCDACLDHPGMGFDTDGDFVCDANDADDDNDTCFDTSDAHPLEAAVKVGHKVGDRRECSGPIYAWEGTILDSGQRLCTPTPGNDVDGDGITDDEDTCRLEPGLGCIQPVSCPLPPPYWRLVCALGGCNELELIAVEVSNPERILARSRFTIVNDTLYAFPAEGQTLLETARTLAGSPPPGEVGAAQTKAERRMRIEIRRGKETIARVAELDAKNIRSARFVPGDVLALTTDDAQTALDIRVAWGVGMTPGQVAQDVDRDGIFDPSDNCTRVANRDQHDADEDGFGNACDPDLDNDGRVTELDRERMKLAIGGEATVPFVGVSRYGSDVFGGSGNPVAYDAGADIDADGHVTETDYKRWSALRLGPSGLRR